MKRKILFSLFAVLVIALATNRFHHVWHNNAMNYQKVIERMLADIQERSNGQIEITSEGMEVSGFPFSYTVEMHHNSVLSKARNEHVEIHSHHIQFTLAEKNGEMSHNVSWLEPMKVIYGKGGEKKTYMVHQKTPLTASLTYDNASDSGDISSLKTPDNVVTKLSSDITLIAKCGEAEKSIFFEMPIKNAPITADIPTNLYSPLSVFVYMIDEALKGQGECVSKDKPKAHNHHHGH